MSSHRLTVLVWILFVLTGTALEALGRLEGSRIPSLGRLVESVMRTRSGRVGVLAAWLWLGLHFFAR